MNFIIKYFMTNRWGPWPSVCKYADCAQDIVSFRTLTRLRHKMKLGDVNGVKRSPKLLEFILWGPWISAPHIMTIYHIARRNLQSRQKWFVLNEQPASFSPQKGSHARFPIMLSWPLQNPTSVSPELTTHPRSHRGLYKTLFPSVNWPV